ncbi:MAG: starch-binding protein, partial [Acutalibacteraceae bacterium]
RTGRLDDVASTVTAGDGIIFTDLSGSVISSLPLYAENLTECSSLDGRNFFFPTSDSVNNSTESKMRYRAGTDADKNNKYISVDFNIITSSMAKLYIDDTSSISCKNDSVRKALRVSLNFNDGTAPVLLCGLDGYKRDNTNFQPVTSITDDGVASTGVITAGSITDYTVNGTGVLKNLKAGESKRVTLNIWLEGTDEACKSDTITDDEFLINIILTTGSNYNKIVTFVDYSPNRWVSDQVDANSSIKMFAIDKNTDISGNYISAKRYPMTKIDDITYTAKLPDTVTNVIFGRFDPYDFSKGYNYWATTQTMGDSDTYYAIGKGKSVDGDDSKYESNYGYWVDKTDLSDGSLPDVVKVCLTESPLSQQIKFTDTKLWGSVNAYFYNSSGDVGTAYPGDSMTYGGTNDLNQTYYTIQIPAEATHVVFSKGNDNTTKTTDIRLGTTEGYYLKEDNSVGEWTTTRPASPSTLIFASWLSPNVYFTSNKYGSTLATLKNVGGKFDPTSPIELVNRPLNYGFSMHIDGPYATEYYLYVPRDAEIIFNGQNANKSEIIKLSEVAKNKTEIKFTFSSPKIYTINSTN